MMQIVGRISDEKKAQKKYFAPLLY
jgi:hypothetical protein